MEYARFSLNKKCKCVEGHIRLMYQYYPRLELLTPSGSEVTDNLEDNFISMSKYVRPNAVLQPFSKLEAYPQMDIKPAKSKVNTP